MSKYNIDRLIRKDKECNSIVYRINSRRKAKKTPLMIKRLISNKTKLMFHCVFKEYFEEAAKFRDEISELKSELNTHPY